MWTEREYGSALRFPVGKPLRQSLHAWTLECGNTTRTEKAEKLDQREGIIEYAGEREKDELEFVCGRWSSRNYENDVTARSVISLRAVPHITRSPITPIPLPTLYS